jgi:hypothetical protein
MFRRLGLSLGATKNYGKATQCASRFCYANLRPHISLIAPRHGSSISKRMGGHKALLKLLGPCVQCDKCRWQCEDCRLPDPPPVCNVCNSRTVTDPHCKGFTPVEGSSAYTQTYYCHSCWQDHQKAKAKEEKGDQQRLDLREKTLDEMVKVVQGIDSVEQVPIKYAVDKLRCDIKAVYAAAVCPSQYRLNTMAWYQGLLISSTTDSSLIAELQITRVRKLWMCSKQRVDAVDFKLWFFRDDLDFDV